MKHKKFSLIFICTILILVVGCTSNRDIEKVDINNIKNNESLILDNIFNVNYEIENKLNSNYEFSFTMEDSENKKENLGSLYINKKSLNNQNDMIVSLNIDNDRDKQYTIKMAVSVLEKNKIIDTSLVATKLNLKFTQDDLSFSDIKVDSDDYLDKRIPIISVKNKDNEVYKIVMEITKK